MANYKLSVTSKEKFRSDFESSRFVKILDKLGLGTTYRNAVAKDFLNDPYVSMDDNYIATLEKHTSLLDGLKHTAKDTYDCVSDSVHYTLDNPIEVARIPYDVLKAIITSPKALTVGVLGVAIANSGCLDKVFGDDVNQSISEYFGNIVVNKENNLTLSDSVVIAKGVVSVVSGDTGFDSVVREQHTTPDGLVFYLPERGVLPEDHYLASYDTDGDGVADARDFAISTEYLLKMGNTLKLHLMGYGVPYDSQIYDVYPDIGELRFRTFNPNNRWSTGPDGIRIELFIDHKYILTVSEDLNNDNYIDVKDVFVQLQNDVSKS